MGMPGLWGGDHPMTRTISVIIPTYRHDSLPNLRAAVRSLQLQTVRPEIIVVVGGDRVLYNQALFLPIDNVLFDATNHGATYARNIGAFASHGDVIAFLDDDEIAHPTWCADLLNVYDQYECSGVGGRNLPIWMCDRPEYLPDEMFWLVGVTHRGFADGDDVCNVRNTFAGNISFDRDVFTAIDGFRTDIGLSNGKLIQGEEPEICDRARAHTGHSFWYTPSAIVWNRVPDEKTRLWYLIRRAFWQGYTKRMLESSGHSLTTEGDYLSVVKSGVIDRITHPSWKNLVESASIGLFTGTVGAGYVTKVIT
jgi:glucosyl-dolichyl phosphate glucuronosyltransferase